MYFLCDCCQRPISKGGATRPTLIYFSLCGTMWASFPTRYFFNFSYKKEQRLAALFVFL